MTRKPDLAEADTVQAGSRLGQVVAGKYRLEKLLGRGGMGEVYEAVHVVVGRRSAIKFLHAHLARGRESGSRFLREAQAAGALESEHLAAVLDFDTADDGNPFLVMEYLSGESLATTLSREGLLPVPRALGILLQVCAGLDVAHRAGIVHRDLKPDNLFVTQQKDGSELIKILDFGIAKLVDAGPDGSVTRSGAVLGTPFYMAPEQARGEKSVDVRVDIYALGVVAYELLSGQKPHPGDSYNAILAHILTQPIAPLATLRSDLPPALIELIERTLAFDPARRPSSASQLARELQPFLGREIAMVDSHFDLRPASSAGAGPLTQPALDVRTQSPDGTLGSAIGDVGRVSSTRHGGRRFSWVVLLAAAVAAGLLVIKLRSNAAPTRDHEPAASAHGVTESASERAVPLPNPTAPVPPAPTALASAASSSPAVSAERSARTALRPIATISAKIPAPSAPSSARFEPSSGEVRFDEKNPY